MKRILVLLFSLILALSIITPAFALQGNAGSFDYDAYLDSILKSKMESLGITDLQALVDKMAEAPAAGNEWFILGIRNAYKDIDYSLYRAALEKYVEESTISNAASRLRIALTLVSLNSTSDFIQKTVNDATAVQGFMTYVFGLHLINNGVACSTYSASDLIDYIVSFQCENGGWSLNGTAADIDVTAMTIEALAIYKDNPVVNESIQKGLSYLSNNQLENGGYSSYGAINPESACQVLMACASVGIDIVGNPDFIKNNIGIIDFIDSFKVSDGQYCHLANGDANTTTQTQVFYSLVAYKMFKESGYNFYVFPELSETLIERTEEKEIKSINIKTILYIAVGVMFVAICIIKALKGKKNFKAYLSAALICAIAIVGISFINIESTDNYYQKKENGENSIFTTISIYCNTIIGQADYVPEDGIILQYKTVSIKEGSNVYDQLVNACKEYKIQMEGSSSYVNGINYIYEFKFGDLSGWMFKVNGEFSSVGCNEYKLKDGDYVEWVFTTNLGKDLGVDDIDTLGE